MAVQVRKNGNLVASVRITFVPGRDDDLIALFRQAKKGTLASVFRESLRSGIPKLTSSTFDDPAPDDEDDFIDLSGLGMDL